jgi:hypothetical protein
MAMITTIDVPGTPHRANTTHKGKLAMHPRPTTPILFLPMLLMLALASYPAASIAADERRDADEAAIASILQAVERGWETGDGQPFREHFLDFDGARYFESGGQNVGLDDLVLHHVEPEKHAIEGLQVDFVDTAMHFEGDFAWVLADTRVAGKILRTGEILDRTGFATFLLRRIDGDWKVVHTHSSTRPRRKDAPAVPQESKPTPQPTRHDH